MYAAHYECLKDLPKHLYHDPSFKNDRGRTVAMGYILYNNVKDLPKEFYHNAILTDDDGWTVAMFAAVNGCM